MKNIKVRFNLMQRIYTEFTIGCRTLGNEVETDFPNKGLFHFWANKVEASILEQQIENKVYGIVEGEDGTIYIVEKKDIKFIEKENSYPDYIRPPEGALLECLEKLNIAIDKLNKYT